MWDTGRILKLGWRPAFLAVLPVLVHLPALTGFYRFDPIYVVSGLTQGSWTTNGAIAGYPGWIDGNAGVTTEALGGLAARLWLHGTVPWWNHYSGAGLPLAAEGQTPAFFLPFVLLLGLPHGLILLRMLLMAVAGACTHALLRTMRLGPMPCLAGAALFELNGVFAWLAHGPMMPMAFLPMVLLGIERARAGGGTRWVTLGLAWSLLAGFPETACLDLLFCAMWAAWRARPGGARLLVRLGLAALFGAMIAAPAVWPFLEALPRSFLGEHAAAVSRGLAAGNPALLLFPSLYGGIFAGPLLLGDHGGVWSRAGGFVDLALVTLAVSALPFSRAAARDRGLRWLLAAWVALTFARACMAPGITGLFAAIPLLRQVMVHVWAVPTWSMACCVLAALALEDWRAGSGPLLRRPALAMLPAAGLALFLARPDVAASWSVLPGEPWFLAGSLLGAGLVIVALAVLGRRSTGPRQTAIAALLTGNAAILFTLPLLAGTHGRTIDAGAIGFLQNTVGTGRVVSFGPLVPNYGALYGIAEIGHNALPVPAAWVAYVRRRLMPGSNGVDFSFGDTPPAATLAALLPALQAAGVAYALTWPSSGDPLAAAGPDQAAPIYRGAVMDIWRLPHPAPYAAADGCTVTLAARDDITADCTRPARLVRRELSWPGWFARLNGQATAIGATADIFQEVSLPAGHASLRFSYAPPWGWAAWVACFVGLAGVAGRPGKAGKGKIPRERLGGWHPPRPRL